MIGSETKRPVTLARRGAAVWAFGALLPVWGNTASAVLAPTAPLPGGSWGYAATGVALAAVSLAAARALDLDARAIGMSGRALRGAAIGLALGVAASAAGVAALRTVAPLVVGGAVDYAPLAAVDAARLAWHVAVLLPLGIVLPEEIAFRGVLVGALARDRGVRTAIVASSALFALWHAGVAVGTVADTTIGPASPWAPVAVGGAFLAIAAGGALFAWLRLATGSLATSIAAHWAFNAIVLTGLWWEQ